MRNMFLTLLMIGGILGSCTSQNVTVNGEQIELEDGLYAKITTNKGDILFRLETEKAPMTSANFVALAEGNHPEVSEEYKGKPYYDGLSFHRVIPNFMIQGGDPAGTGSGGPGYQFPQETENDLTHDKGVVSMANAGPNTNGSQFFITVAATPHLDGSYNIFGEVVKGQEIADLISEVPTNQANKPNDAVNMQKVEIIRRGKEAKDFVAAEVFTAQREALGKKQQQAEMEKRKADEARMNAQQGQVEEAIKGAQSTEKGVYYKVIEEGKGPKPTEGQTVLMNYTGYLMDGTMFDSSLEEKAKEGGVFDERRPYQPFPVQISPQARVIEGWKEALKLMNVGDKFRLIIPPQLGYGERGYPPVIPANSWLIFDVEMVSIQQ